MRRTGKRAVSYTHLEVAKKELLSMENDLSDKKTEESAPEKEKNLKYLPIDELMDLAGTDDIKACCEVYRRYGIEESRYLTVSYTHLDVYKRQPGISSSMIPKDIE